MLKELKEELKNHKYIEDAVLTDAEMNTLKTMFSVQGSYKALFKYMVGIESKKGTQLAYDMEMIPEDATNDEIAEEVKFKKLLVKYARMKMEKLRQSFKAEIEEDITDKEQKIAEEQKENKEKQKQQDQEVEGIGVNV